MPLLSMVMVLPLVSIVQANVGIVGGGIAGLSAASELQKRGIPYTLLEATSRLGGRIYPIKTDDGQWLQMGAEFINGHNNDVFKIAQRLGLINKLDGQEDYFVGTDFGMGTNKLNQTAVDQFSAFAEKMDKKMEKAAKKTPEMTVETYYNKEYALFMTTNTNNRNTFDGLSAAYKNGIQCEWSAPLNDLALSNFDEWDDGTEDGEEWTLKGDGFHAILENITAGISSKNVHLNTKVTEINWSGNGKVKVSAVNSTAFEFDSVIVTLPLGVLKSSPKLFNPPLSSRKQDAIKNIGFGSLQKVFLEYNTSWWGNNVTNLVTPYTSQNNILGNEIKNFDVVSYRNNTLLLWLTGEGPKQTTGMSPTNLGNAVTSHLRTAFQDNTIPAPKTVYTYNWNADPLIGGAYSYITPASYNGSSDEFMEIATPIYRYQQPLVMFAGEHTHSTMYQTTVGAYASGKREANRIINFFMMNGK